MFTNLFIYSYILVAIPAGFIVYKDTIKQFLTTYPGVKSSHFIFFALLMFFPCLGGGMFWPFFLEYPKSKK